MIKTITLQFNITVRVSNTSGRHTFNKVVLVFQQSPSNYEGDVCSSSYVPGRVCSASCRCTWGAYILTVLVNGRACELVRAHVSFASVCSSDSVKNDIIVIFKIAYITRNFSQFLTLKCINFLLFI